MNSKYIVLLFLHLTFFTRSQFDKESFIADFSKTNTEGKVKLISMYPYSDLKDVLPLIKNDLDKIKTEIYAESTDRNKKLRFVLDKTESEKEMHNRNFGKAIFILENTLRNNATEINDSLRCLSLLKGAYVKIKNINKAFEIQYLLASKWHRKSDSALIYYGYKESDLYNFLGLREEAIKQRRKEFDKYENKNDTDAVLNFYNDMGVFYNRKKNSDSAEFYFLKAKALLAQKKIKAGRENHYNFYKGLVDGNLGLSYFNQGNIEKALPLLKHDVYYSIKTKNYESAFNAYLILVKCYIHLKERALAKNHLDTLQDLLSSKLRSVKFRLKFLTAQSEYYFFTEDYRKASETYKVFYNLNDSIEARENEQELINQGVAFNLEKRELEFAEKQNTLRQLQREQNRQKRNRIYLMAGLLILSLVTILQLLNNRRFKRREVQLSIKNQQIQEQNAQIEQSLREKEALIKEIHHRVKNNLQIISSMLNLQIGKIDDEKTEAIFFEAKQRINAIALTHQMLYQKTTISNINLGEYVETLVRQIEATMSSTAISVNTLIPKTEERLTIDGAVPLGLIINELLTNAYKHGFPSGRKGTITVSLIENASSYTIKVNDNGIGLPEGFNEKESVSLGMELVLILVEQLDSKLTIENKNGSSFMFEIKKHN
jgi:two-component sensor histidine kinase